MRQRIQIHPAMTVADARRMADAIGAEIIPDFRGGAIIVPRSEMERIQRRTLQQAPCWADDLADCSDPYPASLAGQANAARRTSPPEVA